jgi:hypothetical protein
VCRSSSRTAAGLEVLCLLLEVCAESVLVFPVRRGRPCSPSHGCCHGFLQRRLNAGRPSVDTGFVKGRSLAYYVSMLLAGLCLHSISHVEPKLPIATSE